MLRTLLLATVAVIAMPAHAQVYKCTVGGSTVYSDKPCATGAETIDVKPASGRGAPMTAPAFSAEEVAEVPSPEVAASSGSSYVNRANDAANRRMLTNRITIKEQDLVRLENEMQSKIRQLQNRRRYANNNLAGATWENSLAEEMNAVSSSYSTRMDVVRAEIDRLRTQRDAIPAN